MPKRIIPKRLENNTLNQQNNNLPSHSLDHHECGSDHCGGNGEGTTNGDTAGTCSLGSAAGAGTAFVVSAVTALSGGNRNSAVAAGVVRAGGRLHTFVGGDCRLLNVAGSAGRADLDCTTRGLGGITTLDNGRGDDPGGDLADRAVNNVGRALGDRIGLSDGGGDGGGSLAARSVLGRDGGGGSRAGLGYRADSSVESDGLGHNPRAAATVGRAVGNRGRALGDGADLSGADGRGGHGNNRGRGNNSGGNGGRADRSGLITPEARGEAAEAAGGGSGGPSCLLGGN